VWEIPLNASPRRCVMVGMSDTEGAWVLRLAGTDWVRAPDSFDMLRSWPRGDVLMPEDAVRRLDHQMWDEADHVHRRSA
jgi:hypothetical protein